MGRAIRATKYWLKCGRGFALISFIAHLLAIDYRVIRKTSNLSFKPQVLPQSRQMLTHQVDRESGAPNGNGTPN